MSSIRIEETLFEEIQSEVKENNIDYIEVLLIVFIVFTTFRSLQQYLYKRSATKIK